MKKLFTIILLFSIGLISQFEIFAASISLINDVPFINGKKSDEELVFFCNVKNNSNKDITLKLKYEIVYLTKGHSFGICFNNQCYPAQTQNYTAPGTMTLGAGQSTLGIANSFHLYPFDLALGNDPLDGVDTIKAIFYNAADETDFADVRIVYSVGTTAIVEDGNIGEFDITDIVPNPAVENVKIDYNLPEKLEGDPFLEVYNPLGERVFLKNLCDCKYAVDLDLNGLASGTYYCNLFMNGKKTKSRNLIIKK